MRAYGLLAVVLCGALLGCAATPDWTREDENPIDESRVVDLTYVFNHETVYWPTADSFVLRRIARGRNRAGEWYASNNYGASEHGGTHMDAPLHFAQRRWSTAEVPLKRLMGPVRVIDVRKQCAEDRNYQLQPEDIAAYERRHGTIMARDIVLVHTGFGRFYPDRKTYLGSEVIGEARDLSFPGIGGAAAEVLVERNIDMVGIDTASLDHGPSVHFEAHRILNGANIPGLENVANLELLPAVGAYLIALPMKIEDGTGGPCRIIAVLPDKPGPCGRRS